MSNSPSCSRRTFLGASTAAALSYLFLPGIGRVQAQPFRGLQKAIPGDYSGRLCLNENPMGPAPEAIAAMNDAATLSHRYPDWYSGNLEAAIATQFGLSAGNICVGAGATEVITLVADAFIGPGDEVIMATPTYTQMVFEASANGGSTVYVPVDGNQVIDLAAIQAAIGPSTRMISLVNPNNPLATVFHKNDMQAFMNALPGGIVVVVDEAYHDYVQTPDYESCVRYVAEGEPLVVIRTFSKVHGLAGARVGYAVASTGDITQISSNQQWGTVSRASQAAAQASLGATTHPNSPCTRFIT